MKAFFKSINYNLKKVEINDYWKLHISCQTNNFYSIRKIVNKICKARNIFYKFPNSEKVLDYILRQKSQKWIYGKVFTIYFTEENYKITHDICEEFYKELKEFKGPRIDSDIRYKNSIIHLRYGTYFSNNFQDGSPDRKEMYFNVKNNVKIPDFIKQEIVKDTKANHIEKYNIEKIIISDNFHTILIAKKDGIKYIMKAYKKYTKFNYLVDIRDNETNLSPGILSFFNKPTQIKINTVDMNIYISKYIPFDSINGLINKAEQSYIEISEEDKLLMIKNMINIYLYLEKTNKYWIDFNLRNMIFFNKKLFTIDLKYLFHKKLAQKVKFSTEDFETFGIDVNKNLLLNNILILKFGYYHFEHLENSYIKKIMALRILILGINSTTIKNNLFSIFKIKNIPDTSSILQIINRSERLNPIKLEKIFSKLISKNIFNEPLKQNRGVWAIEKEGKFYTGLKIGGLGYLINMYIKTRDLIWLERIKENSNYFSIRDNSIMHGLGGYILGEIYLLSLSPQRVNKNKFIQRVALLQILDWKTYAKIIEIIK